MKACPGAPGEDNSLHTREDSLPAGSVAVAGIAILAAPFVSAVGTNNRLAGELAFAATIWRLTLGGPVIRGAAR